MSKLLIWAMSLFLSSVSIADTNCLHEALKIKDPAAQDISLLKCTVKRMPELGLDKCLQVAKTLQYQTYADELRLACYDHSSKPSISACHTAHSQIEDSDTADEFAWTCLRTHNLKMSATQCSKFAGKMSNQAQESRVLYYCLNEIKQNPTENECETLSRKLYTQDSLQDIQSYCRKK